MHEGLIENTSYSLKPLSLLCAALGVDDKLGQRAPQLTAWSRVELSLFSKTGLMLKSNLILKITFDTKIKPDPKIGFHTKDKSDFKIKFHSKVCTHSKF